MSSAQTIAALSALVLRLPDRSDDDASHPRLLLRLELDDGRVGLGAGPRGDPRAWLEAVGRMESLVTGMDPLATTAVTTSVQGSAAAAWLPPAAVGALACALYDAAGHVLGVPATELLGGCYRDAVPASCQVDPGDSTAPSAAARARADGFARVMLSLGAVAPVPLERKAIGAALEVVAATRSELDRAARLEVAIGPVHNVSAAVRLARGLEGSGVHRLQVGGIGLDGLRALRQQTRLPVGLGPLPSREALRPVLQAHLADGVSVDVAALGPAETRRQVDLATHFDALATSAASGGIVGLLTSLQLGSALPGIEAVSVDQATWHEEMSALQTPLAMVEGRLAPPDGPGIGAALRPDSIERVSR